MTQDPSSGFSLVEVLVAAMLLAISATATLTLFSVSEVFLTKSKAQDDDQVAINTDLAEIQKRNRRFACMEGSCTLGDSDPNEDQYTPAHPGAVPPGATFDAQMTAFANLCKQPVGSPSGLLEAFETAALKTLPTMARGITRTYDIDIPSSETPVTPHAYVVAYSKNSQVLRRVRMVPTVAGWCP